MSPGTWPRGMRGCRAAGFRALGLGAALLALAGCTSGTEVHTSQAQTERELVLVQRPDATSQVLGHAYREILADAGVRARLAPPAADPIAEVLAGRADVAVAGSSELLTALAGLPGARGAADASGSAGPSAPAGTSPGAAGASGAAYLDAADTTRELHSLDLAGFAVLDAAEAQRTGTLVVTAATSAGEKLADIDQLGALCPRLEFGIPGPVRDELVPALASRASCTPRSVTELTDEQARGVMPVISDAVQVQATTLEHAGIPDNALVVLQDSGSLFAPQALTPLVTTTGVGRDAVEAINKLSEALKQEDLLEMNRMVSGRDALEPAKAAADWLAERSLVETP